MKYRPKDWEKMAKWTDPSGKGHPDRAYFEAGADAMLDAVLTKIEAMANDGDSVGEILKALREEA